MRNYVYSIPETAACSSGCYHNNKNSKYSRPYIHTCIIQSGGLGMNGRIKKNDYYTGCSYCKRLFCNENYDMGEYAYSLQYNGRKLYFCGFNCMMKFRREHMQKPLRGANCKHS
jgi:hypothetical protein